jgi:hypothetical protein
MKIVPEQDSSLMNELFSGSEQQFNHHIKYNMPCLLFSKRDLLFLLPRHSQTIDNKNSFLAGD